MREALAALNEELQRERGVTISTRTGVNTGPVVAGDPNAGQALVTTDSAARQKLYQQLQQQLNQRGPYFPLIQPTQVFVATTDLKNAVYNATYSIDVTKVSPK